MQRLLVDAEKISGIHYDISSFADVTQAIHVMQESMGIAGTTAKEANTTIEGSINSMKGAWENFFVGLGDKNANMQQLVDNLVQSVQTVLTNVIPIIQNVLTSISNTMPQIITQITTNFPQFMQVGMQLIQSIFNGLMSNLPLIMQGIMQVIQMILNVFITNLPQILQMGITILVSLIQRISSSITTVDSNYCKCRNINGKNINR